jgi:hypothetical protein
MTRAKFPSLAVLVAVLLISGQIALYAFMWVRLLSDPSLKTMDFISFYTAGRIARQGQYSQLFNLDTQRTVQHMIVAADAFPGGVNLSQHPPYLAPLLSLLAVDDFVQAYVLWTAVRVVVMIICGVLIWRFLLGRGWRPLRAILAALASLLFFPFFLGLLGGQDTAFIVLGLLLWMFGLVEKREVRAGFGLALASLSPLIVAALGPPLLAARRKAGLWFILSMGLLGLYSLALIGLQGGRDFVSLMGLSSQGEGYGLNQPKMYNLLGLLLRSLPASSVELSRLISWAAFGLSIILLVILWWNRRENLKIEHVGIAVVISVFTLPHLHAHALSYLLLPLLASITLLHERGHQTLAMLLIPLTSTLALLSIFMDSEINFAVYYALMLALIVGLSLSLRQPRPQVDKWK